MFCFTSGIRLWVDLWVDTWNYESTLGSTLELTKGKNPWNGMFYSFLVSGYESICESTCELKLRSILHWGPKNHVLFNYVLRLRVDLWVNNWFLWVNTLSWYLSWHLACQLKLYMPVEIWVDTWVDTWCASWNSVCQSSRCQHLLHESILWVDTCSISRYYESTLRSTLALCHFQNVFQTLICW